jgi:hypothetical protein
MLSPYLVRRRNLVLLRNTHFRCSSLAVPCYFSAMAIEFTVILGPSDWSPAKNAWDCPTLRIPGAQILSLRSDGTLVDPNWYQASPNLATITWVAGNNPPPQVIVFMQLTQELATDKSKQLWKKIAILVPVITAAMGIVAGVLTKPSSPTKQDNPKPAITTTAPNPAPQPKPLQPAQPKPPRPERKELSFEVPLEGFLKKPGPPPYSLSNYNEDLRSLDSFFTSFLDYLKRNDGRISLSESNQFFQNFGLASENVRKRACTQLPPETEDAKKAHCQDNINNLAANADYLSKALVTSNGSLSSELLTKITDNYAKWLPGALVRPAPGMEPFH